MNIIRTAVAGLFALTMGSAQATLYDYSYTFSNGVAITGSFNGIASGNLITNLSGITASINSAAFNSSGSLFGSSYSYGTGWVTGGAVASLNGTQNNFMFVDANFPASVVLQS